MKVVIVKYEKSGWNQPQYAIKVEDSKKIEKGDFVVVTSHSSVYSFAKVTDVIDENEISWLGERVSSASGLVYQEGFCKTHHSIRDYGNKIVTVVVDERGKISQKIEQLTERKDEIQRKLSSQDVMTLLLLGETTPELDSMRKEFKELVVEISELQKKLKDLL